jgi:pimeloyl-ACP methyl ester carboxylesterase
VPSPQPDTGVLAVHARLPGPPVDRPPIVLVHGAANSARVWTFWQSALSDRGWPSYAIDLRGHGESSPLDLSETVMADYADDVSALSRQLVSRPVLIGWSMGGLAAMMAAATGDALAYVGLGPSLPGRVRDTFLCLRTETFGPDEYGILSGDPNDQPTMPDLDLEERAIALASLGRESRRARDDRKAGIVIAELPCPALIVTGSADAIMPPHIYAGLPWTADFLDAEGASHWGLVLNRRALGTLIPAVTEWIATKTGGRALPQRNSTVGAAARCGSSDRVSRG